MTSDISNKIANNYYLFITNKIANINAYYVLDYLALAMCLILSAHYEEYIILFIKIYENTQTYKELSQ